MTQDLSEKTILRRQHDKDNPYFMLARDVAQNVQLSFEALGLLAYLLSKPDDWKVRVGDITREGCGRDKAVRILNELKTAGHLRRVSEKQSHEKETGHFDAVEWIVSETPYTEKPSTAEPSTAEPFTVNPLLHNTDKQNTELLSTEKESSARDPDDALQRTSLSPHFENAASADEIDDSAERAYQRIDNHTGAMMTADRYIRVFEGACKAYNAPQTIRRTRENRRIAAQWYADGYSEDEIRTAVGEVFEAGKPVIFAFLGEKMAFLRNGYTPASIKGRFSSPPRSAAPPTSPPLPRASSTSEGFSGYKARMAAEAKAKQAKEA